jgi:short subunit dehydrogenase-like uncharacterized protein
MIGACLLARVNYMDLTGEVDVIEFEASQHERAVSAGISIMPAVGFDVVPSDCLAAQLAAALPGAERLELAFMGGSTLSPGTAKTLLAGLGDGGRVRSAGRIVRVPLAWKTARIPFPSGVRSAVTIPWGDVASAFYTTGIGNIEVYLAMPERRIRTLRRWRWLQPLARLAPIQWLGQRWIERRLRGPNEEQRATGRAELWGRATGSGGRIAEATLITPEGYGLTVETALEIVKRTLVGEVRSGFWTPGKAFGGAFIERFAGVRLEWRREA